MDQSLKDILTKHFNKEDLISFMNKHPLQFEKYIDIALSDEQPLAWRAAWLLNNCMKKNDKRIQDKIMAIIKAIATKEDGHQRELLKILEKMNIDEDYEGYLFNVCISIWEAIDKSPSVRILAFRILAKITKKYPELKNELKHLTQKHYTETLSPGIRNSFFRIKKEL